MASIQEHLDRIKNAIFGKDVRQAIHDSIKQCYDDAAVNHDNANMEVKLARGSHNTLNDRLVENEKKQEKGGQKMSKDTKQGRPFIDLKQKELKILETGTKAPDFTLADKEGNKVSLSDFLGKKVVLYFYPKDNTPGCTRQACALLDVKLISSLRTNRFQLENGINNTVSLFCQ